MKCLRQNDVLFAGMWRPRLQGNSRALNGQRDCKSSGHGLRTSIYRQSRSEKLVIMVVMKGWPATAESVFRSFLICSTCFKRMTTESESTSSVETHFVIYLLSTLRSIFRAKTFCPSFGDPARQHSHTRAKVPEQNASAQASERP